MRRLLIVLGVGSAFLATAGIAYAESYVTVSTLRYSPLLNSGFTGEVGSEDDRCVSDRVVAVFKDRRDEDKKIGSDRTDDEGNWFVEGGLQDNAEYYVRVKELQLVAGDVCLAYKSRPKDPF